MTIDRKAELTAWLKIRAWFKDSPVWVANVLRLDNGMMRLCLRHHDHPGLTWNVDVPESTVQSAIDGHYARQYYITNLAHTLTKTAPRTPQLHLVRNDPHGRSSRTPAPTN